MVFSNFIAQFISFKIFPYFNIIMYNPIFYIFSDRTTPGHTLRDSLLGKAEECLMKKRKEFCSKSVLLDVGHIC
jgi:hypothetical protein